jgi:predicted aldo/keto reductase-like oxidoreductase
MIYKKVARIEEQISAIGIGCWGFGGDWDTTNDHGSSDIVNTAIDEGVNLIAVGGAIIERVSYEVTKYTGTQVRGVNVYIDSMMIG